MNVLLNHDQLVELADMIADRIAAKTSRRFVSREEFAKANGLSVRTVDRMIADGKLGHRKVGRRVLISADSICSDASALLE